MNFFSKHLSLNKASIAFLGLLGVSSPSFAEIAARVTFVTGQVSVIDSSNNKRSVYKGDLIRSGEKIETVNGRVQVRMTDGGIIVLRQNSLFEISKYSFSKDTPELGTVLFNFIKGGARAISGAIGKANRLNYQFKTPVATIGIRGTDYSSSLENGTLKITVTSGKINVANTSGEADVNEGETYIASNSKQPVLCHNTNSESTKEVNKACEPVIVPLEAEDGVYLSKEKIKKPLLENFSSYGAYAEAIRQYKLLENEYILAGGQTEKDDSFTMGLITHQTNELISDKSPFDDGETLDANEMRGSSIVITKYPKTDPKEAYIFSSSSLDTTEMRASAIVSAIGIQPEAPPSLLQMIEIEDFLQKKVFSSKLADDLLSNNPNALNDEYSQSEIDSLLSRLVTVNTKNFLGSNLSIIGADFGQADIDVFTGRNSLEGITVQLAPGKRNQNYFVGRGVLSADTLAQIDSNNNKVFRGFSFKQGLIHDNNGIVGNRNSGSLAIGDGSLEQSTALFMDDSASISVNLGLAQGLKPNTVNHRVLSINIETPKLVIKLGDIYVSNSDSSAANINKNGALNLGAPAVLGSNQDGSKGVKIMGPLEVILGAASINARLEHRPEAVSRFVNGVRVLPKLIISADAYIREGLTINHIDLKDTAGTLQGGSLMIDSLKITDYGGQNLTAKLAVDVEESGKGSNTTIGGLLLTLKQLGDAMNGIDIAMNNLRVGTSTTPNIGDIQVIGLDLNGSFIVLHGH